MNLYIVATEFSVRQLCRLWSN